MECNDTSNLGVAAFTWQLLAHSLAAIINPLLPSVFVKSTHSASHSSRKQCLPKNLHHQVFCNGAPFTLSHTRLSVNCSQGRGARTMPKKECPSCKEQNQIRTQSCKCGHAFYELKKGIEKPKYNGPSASNLLPWTPCMLPCAHFVLVAAERGPGRPPQNA